MKQSSDIVRGSITHSKIVYFTVFILIALGIYGLFKMNKDEFPTFEIKQGLVVGIFPGATAQEVEELLTKPLENTVFSFSEVSYERTTSISKDGICYIIVDLDAPTEKKNEVWSRIKHSLNTTKMTLPTGVMAVAVMDDFSAVSAMLIAMESDDKSYSEMLGYAESLKTKLRDIPALENVTIIGTQPEEIAVNLDLDKLSSYGLSPSSLMLDYQTSGLKVPAGKLYTEDIYSPIRVEGIITNEQEVAERIVYADPDGNYIRLKDVATIERRYQESSSFVDYNGHTALVLSITMRPDNNIVAFGKDVDKILSSFEEELPQSVRMSRITDQPKVVDNSVMSFLRDLLISMLVVIFVMLMLFPIRSALIASSGVPVCTAVTLAIMYIFGIPLNTVTLAALIVVLGMIVDDSIITMDGYMDKLSKGMNRMDAACASAKELFMPMFMATFAISAMFFPMLGIITGYLGEFVRLFPFVIAIALAASLIYAMMVVPSMEVRFISQRSAVKETGFAKIQNKFFNFIQKIYDKAEIFCFNHAKTTIAIGVLAVGIGIYLFTRLNIQLMPMAARDSFAIEISMEGGNGLNETKAVSDSLQKILLKDNRVESVTAFIGTSAPRFHATYTPRTPAPNVAQLIVNTKSNKATEDVLSEFGEKYEHHFPSALIRFKQMDYQGVVPISITLSGDEAEELKPYSDAIRNFMYGMTEELQWVHSNIDELQSTVNVSLSSEDAARLGINKASLTLSLSGSLNGQNIGNIWEKDKKIPINIYNNQVDDTSGYEVISNHMVPGFLSGTSVPLRQIGELKPDWKLSSIPHTSGKKSATVYADMKFGQSQPAAMAKIKKFINDEIKPQLPPHINIAYGGLSSSNKVVGPQILLAFICAVFILFLFLLIHFRKASISILTLVLSTLCLFGAFLGIYIFKLDFTMTAVLGLISLVGIIVRNGIIMFEYAEELRFSKGYSVKDAAMEAGKRRMRPIFLTSCTTALGVLPMIISGDMLWMPMGVVICFGTMLSIALIVLIMPVSYWLVFRKDDMKPSKEKNIKTKAVVAIVALFLAVPASAQKTLTLEECKNMALINEVSIKNAHLDVLAAKAQKQEALAEYFPKVSINSYGFWAIDPMIQIGVRDIVGYNDFGNNLNSIINEIAPHYGFNPVFETMKYGWGASLSIMQPVFAGGRIINGNKLASLGVEASILQEEIVKRNSGIQIEEFYWQIVALQEKMLSLDTVQSLLDTLQRDVQTAYEAGIATETDMMQVKIKANELRSGKSQLKNGIRLAKMNLLNTIGFDYCITKDLENEDRLFIDNILLSDSNFQAMGPQTYYIPEEEMADKIAEKQLLDLSVKAKKYEKAMTLGEALPQLGVGFSYGYSKMINQRHNGTAFAMLQIPISDWGKTARKIQRQDYQLQKAQNNRDFLNAQIILQIRQLWVEVTNAWEQLQIAKESTELSQKNHLICRENFAAGLIPVSGLLEAQTTLRQAVEKETDAKIAYLKALSSYTSRQ